MALDASEAPTLLSFAQKAYHAEYGYLQLESFITNPWLSDLRTAGDEFVETSRELTKSNRVLDLEPGHSSEDPPAFITANSTTSGLTEAKRSSGIRTSSSGSTLISHRSPSGSTSTPTETGPGR
jgi:hypothetical protein